MERIELEAESFKDSMESGLSAFAVPKFKARLYTHDDGESGLFLDSLGLRLILICFILILG
eukprot:316338-Rhodomonas_salina.1